MLKKVSAVILMALLLNLAGCSEKKEEADAAPAAKVVYGQGFFGEEAGADGKLAHWMAEEGVIRLRNAGADMVLKVVGTAPVGQLPQPPTITVEFNGEQLDRLTAAPEGLSKEYTIPAAKQGRGDYSELKITTSKAFVPKESVKDSTDDRHFGFKLTDLVWEAKSSS
jgi:hypothetical protein